MDASSKYQHELPVSSDALLKTLADWGVPVDYYEHIPLRTVEDAKTVQGSVVPDGPGIAHIKNFYLRDRKKRNYLIVLEQDREVDMKALGEAIGAGRVSFGSAGRLMEFLGVCPGAVSPLAMVNGSKSGVTLFMDRALQQAERIHVHPLVNDRTIAIAPDDLLQVLARWGADVSWLDL